MYYNKITYISVVYYTNDAATIIYHTVLIVGLIYLASLGKNLLSDLRANKFLINLAKFLNLAKFIHQNLLPE